MQIFRFIQTKHDLDYISTVIHSFRSLIWINCTTRSVGTGKGGGEDRPGIVRLDKCRKQIGRYHSERRRVGGKKIRERREEGERGRGENTLLSAEHCSTCVHFNWKDTWRARNLTNGTCHRASFNICALAHGHWDWNELDARDGKNNKILCKYIEIYTRNITGYTCAQPLTVVNNRGE